MSLFALDGRVAIVTGTTRGIGLAIARRFAEARASLVLASDAVEAIDAHALANAGISRLARNLAVQWRPRGLRVNAIVPGLIRKGFSEPLLADDGFMARRLAMTPLRRAGEADEVAATASGRPATRPVS